MLILFISIFNFNYLNILLLLILKFGSLKLIWFLNVIIVGTISYGAFLLSKQNCLKGFLGISSVLNISLILISIINIKIYSNNILYDLSSNSVYFIYSYILLYIINSLLFFLYWVCLYSIKPSKITCKTYFRSIPLYINNIKDYNLFLLI